MRTLYETLYNVRATVDILNFLQILSQMFLPTENTSNTLNFWKGCSYSIMQMMSWNNIPFSEVIYYFTDRDVEDNIEDTTLQMLYW